MKKKTAKKMRLNLDDLKVESFATSSDLKMVAAGAGTCNEPTCTYSCGQVLTCNGGPC